MLTGSDNLIVQQYNTNYYRTMSQEFTCKVTYTGAIVGQ